MKRTDTVQLAIIIVALFIGYVFLNAVPTILLSLFGWINSGMRGGEAMEFFFGTFSIYFFYFFTAFFSLRYSKQIAHWVCNKADFSADINFSINKTDLLYVLFIGLGIYGLIQSVPALLVTAFDKIKSNNSFMPPDAGTFTTANIVIKVITLLLYFSLVYYAGTFADFFSGKIKNKEPEDEIAGEKTTD
jgi:hypothetical protein